MLKLAAGIIASLVLLRIVAAWHWKGQTRQAVAQLTLPEKPVALREDELSGLPEPVKRYFRRALARRVTGVRGARHQQSGEFQLNGWKPLTATQWHTTGAPGFVWDANIRMAPGVSVDVRDGYGKGQGAMVARLWGLWPMMDQRGGAEPAAGALQRYLGEAVWFPTALLPSRGVVWTAIDERTARATLRDGDVSAELDFRFNNEGDVTGAYAAHRFRESNGRFVATPWEFRCWAWAEQDGLRIPMESEVAWVIDGERKPYWRARIDWIEYE